MFYGNYPGSQDEKGRVHIPSVLARLVKDKDTLKIAKWRGCLAVFPSDSFERMAEMLAEKGRRKEYREKVHRIVASFFPAGIKNGKLLIPQELRNGVKLDKKVQIVGMLDHIEIWNQSDWQAKADRQAGRELPDDLDDLEIL